VSRAIRQFVIDPDEDTIVHLHGAILGAHAMRGNIGNAVLMLAYYDDNVQETTHIIRIFKSGENIPYHFTYVDTVTFASDIFHVCSYCEDDEAWTPTSTNDDAAPSANSLEAPSS
jgi:hypothetical protein